MSMGTKGFEKAKGDVAGASFAPIDDFDRQLLQNVRPDAKLSLDTTNAVGSDSGYDEEYHVPEGGGRYNLVVIGAGAGGLVSAAAAAGLGARVALIEKHLMGGDCLNSGCVPSKALITAAQRCDAECRTALKVSDQEYFQNAMQNMRKIRAQLSQMDSVKRFTELGVDVFLGDAKFVSSSSVAVCNKKIMFSKCIVATGGRPQVPRTPGLADCKYYTSRDIFTISSLPQRLVVIGAGPMGVELAQAFRLFGSHVVCICKDFMSKEDPEAAALIKGRLEESGVEIIHNDAISRIEEDEMGGERAAKLLLESGRLLSCCALLIATGRAPNMAGLDLDKARVKFDERGIVVNEFLQSSNPSIYAVGDVATEHKFTHAADAMARIAIRNSLFFGRQRFSALQIPRCTYTCPEVASVGVCKPDSRVFDIYSTEFSEIDRCVIEGNTDGFVRVICRKGTDVIVGATIVGQGAGDLISEISVAMAGKVGLGKLASVLHPYPTKAEAIRKCGDKYNKTRLTPMMFKLFARMFAFRR